MRLATLLVFKLRGLICILTLTSVGRWTRLVILGISLREGALRSVTPVEVSLEAVRRKELRFPRTQFSFTQGRSILSTKM